MITITLIMLVTLAIDGVFYGWFVSPFGYGLTLICVTACLLILHRTTNSKIKTVGGWDLGKGIELSNPEDPMSIDNVVIQDAILKLGFLCIGGPGSGKTESVAIGYLDYQYNICNRGWAYHEGKGEKDIYQKAVAAGLDPDFFFSSELPNSDTINLMDGESFDVCDRLAQFLIGHAASTSYFSDGQRKALWVIMPLLKGLGKVVTLRDLFVVCTVEEAGIELLRLAKRTGVDKSDIELADQWYSRKRSERLGEISGLLNRLYIFVAGSHTDRVNAVNPTIQLDDIVQNGKKIYFHLPLSDYARDLAISITEMFAVIARQRQQRGGDRNIFPLMYDDWGRFFYENFGPNSARCRSAAMPLSFGFQSIGQLNEVAPTFTTTLDDTVATKILLRINGQDTAEFGCKLFGEFETLEVGMSELGGRDGSSFHTARSFRLKPNDLKSLNDGETYLSTITKDSGEVNHHLYRARFPLPNMDGWESIDWPKPKVNESNEGGLNFWERYMTKELIVSIQQEIKNQVLEDMEELEC